MLRDLIFGKKARGASDPAPVPLDSSARDAAPGDTAGQAAAPPDSLPDLPTDAPPEGEAGLAAPGQVPERQPLYPVLGLILGGGLPLADRRRAVVDELSRALSLRHVALIGTDRSARLLVANRRVLAARFLGPDVPVELDLRLELVSEPKAMVLHAALAELLAAPVDLMVETRPASGVYAAEGGLPVELLAVDEATLRAAFAPPEPSGAAEADPAADGG